MADEDTTLDDLNSTYYIVPSTAIESVAGSVPPQPRTPTPDLNDAPFGAGRLIGNYLIVFLSGCVAAAAGVGGGAIYTPLYILLFDLL
jgi:uncharacterized membrane protein YfcA